MSRSTIYINTIDNKPGQGKTGEVYVDGKLVIEIYRGNLKNYMGKNASFPKDVVAQMDAMIKAWIKDNL